MKVLIAYSSKNGVSEYCARLLCRKLPQFAVAKLVNLSYEAANLNDFDVIIFGGSIRFGRFSKKLRKFIKNNLRTLSEKPCAAFVCCGFLQRFEEYAEMQIPRKLNCSLGVHNFGGELKPEKLHGFDKLATRIIRSSIKSCELGESDTDRLSLPEIIPENIVLLAESLKNLNI